VRQTELTDGQQRLLKRFSEVGGVVDFVLFESERAAVDQSAHHEAVVLGLREIQHQADEYAERTSHDMGIPKSDIFQVTIDEHAAEALIPQRITWREFLGPRYDFERGGLIVRGKGEFLNEFFLYRDPATRENIIPPDGIDWGIGTGFAYAFSSPPYPLQTTAEQIGEMFDKFLQFIIAGSEESIIFAWPTDWSDYFDAGKEWWGSLLWSLSNPNSKRIVVIAASTTD
jgi:hypothetical protein